MMRHRLPLRDVAAMNEAGKAMHWPRLAALYSDTITQHIAHLDVCRRGSCRCRRSQEAAMIRDEAQRFIRHIADDAATGSK